MDEEIELKPPKPAKVKQKMEWSENFGKPVELPELQDNWDHDKEQEYEELLAICAKHIDLEDVDENQVPKIFTEAKTNTKAQIYLNEQINKMADLVGLREILMFINDMWLEGEDLKSILDVKNNFAIYKELREYEHEKTKYK